MPKFDFRQLQQGLGLLVTLITLISAIVGLSNQLGGNSSLSGSNATTPENRTVHISQQDLIDATNRFRTQHGLPALLPLPALNNLAQDWSETMAQTGDYRHRSPLEAPGEPDLLIGENIAMKTPSQTAEAFVKVWANSPGHRENMLNPDFTHIGVGIADNGTRRYATQNFGYFAEPAWGF